MTRKKRLLLFATGLAVSAVAFVLASPYPRQLLFGPKVRGVPLCAWQDEARRDADPRADKSLLEKVLAWLTYGQERELEWEKLARSEREDIFLSLIEDPSSDVRLSVAMRLNSPRRDVVWAGLARLLADPDWDVCNEAGNKIMCLAGLADGEKPPACWQPAHQALHKLLAHRDEKRRRLAVQQLELIESNPAELAAVYIRMLDDPAPKVRAMAARRLGMQYLQDEAVDYLKAVPN